MVITWLYDCLSTPIKIWSVPVTVPRNNAVLFMKWHTQTISKSLNNSNKLLPEKTTDIIKWCHSCGFPCEKMSEEQVLKFHTLTWRVTTLIWVISLHQYGISAGSFLRRRFAGKPATEASLNVGSFLRLHYYCSCHNDASFKLYLLLLLWSQVYYQSESQMLWSYSVSRDKLSHSTNFHSLCVKTAQLHLIFYKVDFFVCKMIVPIQLYSLVLKWSKAVSPINDTAGSLCRSLWIYTWRGGRAIL